MRFFTIHLPALGQLPHIDEKLAKTVAVALGCDYVYDAARAWEHGTPGSEVLPLDILDYGYAILHSSAYWEKYRMIENFDLRLPYSTDEWHFRKLVDLGAELRQTHLLQLPGIEQILHLIKFPVEGHNVVTRQMTADSPGFESHDLGEHLAILKGTEYEHDTVPGFEQYSGRVYINDTQYFDGVSIMIWEFCIGGNRPAQKWLKERHGKALSPDEIIHYRKLIIALTYIDTFMRKADKLGAIDTE